MPEPLHTAAAEAPFEVPAGGGALVGHRGGDGPPALVLHGGPGMTDYTGGLAAELSDVFSTTRYTQRGVGPSTLAGPYTIESHSGDALAVLDHFGIERAWAVGHSWGGHLALHLAVRHPERLLGVIAVDALGAYGGQVSEELAENLRRRLTVEQRARIAEIDRLRQEGTAGEGDLDERWRLLWPQYFADPATAPPPVEPARTGPARETFASIEEHFERGTLVGALPGVRPPVLFVHGVLDPLPLWSAERTAALVPGARLEPVPGCGHFPWLERPGELRRIVGDFLAEQA